jgi:hypothetical protein
MIATGTIVIKEPAKTKLHPIYLRAHDSLDAG